MSSDRWIFASDLVTATLVRAGGKLAPVQFRLGGRTIQPFAISPWRNDEVRPPAPRVLRQLRGDFFCAPFGDNASAWKNERHPPHGEAANSDWTLVSRKKSPIGTSLVTRMRPRIRRGELIKTLELRTGETNVYCRHEFRGFSGPMCFGHHAMLQLPALAGSGRVGLRPFQIGQVLPAAFENPANGGYQSLRQGARFKRLDRVPLSGGERTDLSAYPARAGFEDLAMVGSKGPGLGWSTVSVPSERYVWYALKNLSDLPCTLLWHSNGGRHYPPWSGRHRNVLGVEDILAYFNRGLAGSIKPNSFSRAGVPTHVELRADRSHTIPYIMGVAAIPARFGKVANLKLEFDGIVLTDKRGTRVKARVDLKFLDHECV